MAFNIAYTYQLIDKYTAPIQKIIAATRAHTRYLKENQDAIKASNATLTKMANRSERLNGSLKALEGNNALKHLTTQAKALNAEVDKMGRGKLPAIGGKGGGSTTIHHAEGSGKMSRFGMAASALTGIGATEGIKSVLKQTAAVESAMIDMGRATNLPGEELKKFEEKFMSLSEQIGISTDKLAIMAFEGSKTGIDNADLEKYVKLTANAAVSFEILESEAGRALGSIKAKMGLNIDQLTKMMDVTNFVADATSADGERMINVLERLSGQFKTLHLSPEVAAGFAGVADQLETSPELAASGMNMMLSKLMNSGAIAAKMLKAPEDTLRSVMKKYASMPEAKRIAAINKAFGLEAGRFVIKLAGNMELFEETMKKAKDAKALGSMEREMQSKLKSLTMLWKNMSNAVTNVMVAIGEGLAPDIKRFGEYLREVTPKIREFVRQNPAIVKFAAGVALAVAAITLAVPIAWALGSAFSFIGAAVGLLSTPLLIVGGLIAGIVWRWSEWTRSGHPLVKVITSISDKIGKIISSIGQIMEKNGVAKVSIDLLAKAFDFLGAMIAAALAPLDEMLGKLEKITELGSKEGMLKAIKENPLEAAESVKLLLPGPLRMLTEMASFASPEQKPVTGTITVKAEPGTDAKVSQPSLPTGSNLVMMKKQ